MYASMHRRTNIIAMPLTSALARWHVQDDAAGTSVL
jgi:hypothetical protein